MARTPGFKITKSVIDMLSETRKPSILPETGWWKAGASEPHQISFDSDWVNSGAVNHPDTAWWLSEDGEGRLRGKVRDGSVGNSILTLPEEIRPEFDQEFICPVDDDGNIDLSNIRFRAYQEGDLE